MNILIVSQYYSPEIGAAQARLSAVARELTRLGHRVEVLTALPNHPTGKIFAGYRFRLYKKEILEGISVTRLWLYPSLGSGIGRMISYLSFMLASFFGFLLVRRPDWIFVESPPLFLFVPSWVWAKIWRRPVIFNVADIWPDAIVEFGLIKEGILIRMARKLERFAYRNSRYIAVVTQIFKERLIKEKGVPAEKILFLPNGVDTELFNKRPPDSALKKSLGLANANIFLYAGTMGYAHGIDVALQAAKKLETLDPSIHVLFVGDGSEKSRLLHVARDLDLGNVSFLPPVSIQDVPRYYSIAVAGLSTLRESYNTRPVKIFSTMACEKPLVYSGAGEGADIVKKAGAGVVTPPNDPNALAEAMLQIVAHQERAREYGRNGRSFVEREMSWSKVVGEWVCDVK